MSKEIKTKVTAILCAILVLFSLEVPAFAASANGASESIERINAKTQATDIIDTTDLTQTEYEANLKDLKTTTDTNLAIQSTCELFISSIYASRRDAAYDCTAFTTQGNRNAKLDDTLAYIESQNQYQREIAELCDFKIVSDDIKFEDFSATVNGNTCNAEIAMYYSYEMTGEFEDTFYLNCVYYLRLENTNNGWRIVSAKTSMPYEQEEDFTYEAFDAHAAALAVEQDHDFAEVAQPKETSRGTASPMATYQTTAYSPTSAVNYALKYYNKTNSLFGASSANCQNFASQCVWAGLLSGCGGSGTTTTAFPAVSTAWTGSDSENVWCRNQYTTYYGDKYWLNWGWDNVNGFLKLIWISDHTLSGPQGYYWLGLAKACVGDVIIWDTAGTRSVNDGTYDHAMVVTRATGTSGSRGVSNLCVAANTSATTSAYMPLAQYCSYSASCFATAHITGGYYKI